MAPLAWRLRVYWKRYTFGALASCLAAKYIAKKVRDNNIIRAYCDQAKRYGEERAGKAKNDGQPQRMRKLMVFLNPTANKREAKIQFLKYSAPLFFLSGVEITVVESQYEGHLRTLMSYIDPKTDAIVVAGGDGTIMEVVTGLMRRTDPEVARSIPIGIIPLGKENQFYKSNLSHTTLKPPVRVVGDATMDIIRGEQTKPVHMLELKPESGRVLYALSSLQWGAVRDAYENRDGFRLFGKLRLFLSHLNVATRRWPMDYVLHLWYPKPCRLEEDSGSFPPSNNSHTQISPSSSSSSSPTDPASPTRQSSVFSRPFLSHAHCIKQKYVDVSEERKASSSADHFETTKLAGSKEGGVDMEHKELKVIGFHLTLQPEGKEEGGKGSSRGKEEEDVKLKLTAWTAGSINKNDFIKHGWLRSMGRPPLPFPSLSLSTPHLILQPCSHTESWVSIDGEGYEAMPVAVRALPAALRVFIRRTA